MASCDRYARALCLLLALTATAEAGALRTGLAVTATSRPDVDLWTQRLDELLARDLLHLAESENDRDFPGRRHLRYEQRFGGRRVFGAQLVRQVDGQGQTLTVFGRILEDVAIDVQPTLTAEQAARVAEAHMGAGAQVVGGVELLILPLPGRNVLAYMLWARLDHRLDRFFVDARSGEVALRYDDLHTASAVGLGTGVFGDRKKVSANRTASTFEADDLLRPPSLLTYDMRFNLAAADRFLRTGSLPSSFVARDSDNDWGDGGVVDAHAYAGLTYDYYFKRHGRRGIDGRDLTVRSLTHFAPPALRFDNAFWDSFTRSMFYGDGDPDFYDVFSGALDVVAHELTHGVTDFTWRGIYLNESGALNEAFSDIMAASVEFFHEPAGNGRKMADYWIGEDLGRSFDPARFAFRSMDNPSQFCSQDLGCDPDHYSRLYRGPVDDGGVHVNSGIANHAFYLLIEGGTNRTSGLRVAGLGGANRERAERIFYRGFTLYLTPNATFSDARAATVQAARDLFGASSAEAAQVAEAWTAVGVP